MNQASSSSVTVDESATGVVGEAAALVSAAAKLLAQASQLEEAAERPARAQRWNRVASELGWRAMELQLELDLGAPSRRS